MGRPFILLLTAETLSPEAGRPPLSGLGIGWILLISIIVFVLIILWAVWYYRFVAGRIYGNIHNQLHAIAGDGVWPGWDAELVKRLGRARSRQRREKVLKRHAERVDRRVLDLIAYAESSSTIYEDERGDYVAALEAFRVEHRERMERETARLRS